ncbi:MAG: tripartite tricarboxylate transporter substrate binding protein BugD [Alphaproteobacteria bacterium]|nr:tripartite tricarboxylate transporter substrate binding protein BugD [Alphaproteobacteria bacterium]
MKKALAFAAALALMAGAASAQQYPTKPITVIVPFAAGGPTDVIARIVGESMSKTLGQQLVIENIAGAGGTTGITRGKEAANDGYTIMMGHMGTHGAAPALYPNIRYNPVTDFEPIGMAAGTPIVIVARKDFPAANLKEFADRLKAGQDKLNEANAGVGSVSHTTCTLLHVQLGTKPTRVPYTGTGPVLNDLVGGKVDYACDQIVNLVTQIQAGAIRAYAIATPTRSPALPDVPTTKEAGMPEYEVSAWNALFAPKGTPAPNVDRLNDALSKALDDANSRKRLLDLGGVLPEGNERTSAWLGTFVAAEVDRWGKTIRAAR